MLAHWFSSKRKKKPTLNHSRHHYAIKLRWLQLLPVSPQPVHESVLAAFRPSRPPLCALGLAFSPRAPRSSSASFCHGAYHQPPRIISVTLLLSLWRPTVNSPGSGPCLIYLYPFGSPSLGIRQSSLNLVWMKSHMVGSCSWFPSYLKYYVFKKDVLTPSIGGCAAHSQPGRYPASPSSPSLPLRSYWPSCLFSAHRMWALWK